MIILLLILWIGIQLLHYRELRHLVRFVTERNEKQPQVCPPKARGSFVVKRMEEKLKEAMYPNE